MGLMPTEMSESVLFVDESMLVLEAVTEMFRARGIGILVASGAREALELFRQQNIAVIVADRGLPEVSGLELLTRVKEVSPETVKIIIAANADLASALEAINRIEVFRYLIKPLNEAELVNAVHDAIRRHCAFLSLRKEEERVLRSLTQTIELKDPSTKGHCDRVAILAHLIADAMQLPNDLLREIKYGSWIHDCGKIGISETILNGTQKLTADEFAIMKLHAGMGADIAVKANLSPVARNIVYHHHERYDGAGYPTGIGGMDIPLEARIVAVADVYDALISDRPYRKKFSQEEAIAILRSMQGKALDPELVELFVSLMTTAPLPVAITERGVHISELQPAC